MNSNDTLKELLKMKTDKLKSAINSIADMMESKLFDTHKRM